MRTILDQDDVEMIAQRVVEAIRPILPAKEDEQAIIFSVEDLAGYLRVSAKWVYDHAHELPHFKLGGLLRFRKADIDRVIDRLFLKANAKKTA